MIKSYHCIPVVWNLQYDTNVTKQQEEIISHLRAPVEEGKNETETVRDILIISVYNLYSYNVPKFVFSRPATQTQIWVNSRH